MSRVVIVLFHFSVPKGNVTMVTDMFSTVRAESFLARKRKGKRNTMEFPNVLRI
jgi:hypothetical protein